MAAKRKRDGEEPVCEPEAPATPDYLKMILTAPVYDVAKESPLTVSDHLCKKTRNRVWLKREDDQCVFSFKLRGAYNKMQSLPQEELQKGVLACSAGNHAQGVALAARKLGTKSTICMPTCTPNIKVDCVRRLGGTVILHGLSFDDAKEECIRLHKETGSPIIHPYDDPHVIAGQGTIAAEIFRQVSCEQTPDIIFCAVGGGGLASGILCYTKRLFPQCKVIGVEADDANGMQQSLMHKKVITLKTVGVFADGAAVKTPGTETFRICSDPVTGLDDCVTVTNDEICAAIKDIFEDTRSIVEPAGALSVAGMKRYVADNKLLGKKLVCVTSGANINFSRLRFVAERAEMGEKSEMLLCVVIPEVTGSFIAMYDAIQCDITEFSYRQRTGDKAFILLAVALNGSDREAVVSRLRSKGYTASDVTGMTRFVETSHHLRT
ncbi:Threonine dehydratase [Diplonema papillatum]|nr:Threonine dehydratase [Diplonema papillatum]